MRLCACGVRTSLFSLATRRPCLSRRQADRTDSTRSPCGRQDFIRIPSAGGCQKGAGSRDCTGEVSPNPTPPPPGAQGAPGRSPARAGQRNTRDRGPENQQELKNRYGQPLHVTLIWIPAPSGKRGVKPGARALAGVSVTIFAIGPSVVHWLEYTICYLQRR